MSKYNELHQPGPGPGPGPVLCVAVLRVFTKIQGNKCAISEVGWRCPKLKKNECKRIFLYF